MGLENSTKGSTALESLLDNVAIMILHFRLVIDEDMIFCQDYDFTMSKDSDTIQDSKQIIQCPNP
jgi:hypothetical protein